MQGGYEKTATILRQLIELRSDGLLEGIFHFNEDSIQPATRTYVSDTVEVLRARYGGEYTTSTIKSTLTTTLPTFLGLTFKPFDPTAAAPAKPDRVDALEARIDALEEKLQELEGLLV